MHVICYNLLTLEFGGHVEYITLHIAQGSVDPTTALPGSLFCLSFHFSAGPYSVSKQASSLAGFNAIHKWLRLCLGSWFFPQEATVGFTYTLGTQGASDYVHSCPLLCFQFALHFELLTFTSLVAIHPSWMSLCPGKQGWGYMFGGKQNLAFLLLWKFK